MGEIPAVPAQKPASNHQLADKRGAHVRLRAFILGIFLVVLDNFWIIRMEHVEPGPYPTFLALFANAVFILAILVLLNSAARRVMRRSLLTQAELLAVYLMVCIGAAIACYDLLPIVIQMMTHPFRVATPENRWMELFGPHLPQWLMMSDPVSLKSCYEGNSSIYIPANYRPWLMPSLWWLAFTMVLVYVMMCINVIVRKQWMDNERLTFPIVQLPLAMTEPSGAFWRNRLLWAGFAVAAGVNLLNGIHVLYPTVPQIDVKGIELGALCTSKPLNAIHWTPFTFYPFIIGLGFLLPADLLLSTWFFYLLGKLQLVAASAWGMDANPQFPYVKQQSVGALLALFVVLLWASRGYLKRVWRRILDSKSGTDDSGEAMSYRSAAAGTVVGVLLMSAFFSVIGLSPLLAVAAFIMYFAIATVVTRVRAELGPASHDLYLFGPDDLFAQAIGTRNLSTENLTGMAFLFWFNRSHESQPMAHGLEGLKMAAASNAGQKRFLWAIMIAALIGGISTFWAYLHYSYSIGCANFALNYGFWKGDEVYSRLEHWMLNPTPSNTPANLANVFGFGFCLLLGSLRMKFCGWPFHPIGYAMSGVWATNIIWGPFLVAWILKIAVLRFGGHKLYRQVVPMFLGVVLGDLVMGMLWSLIGMTLGMRTYSFCL